METIFRMIQNRNVISVLRFLKSMIILVWHVKVAQFLLCPFRKITLGSFVELQASSLDSLCSNPSLKVTSEGFNIQFMCLKTLRPMVRLQKKYSKWNPPLGDGQRCCQNLIHTSFMVDWKLQCHRL